VKKTRRSFTAMRGTTERQRAGVAYDLLQSLHEIRTFTNINHDSSFIVRRPVKPVAQLSYAAIAYRSPV